MKRFIERCLVWLTCAGFAGCATMSDPPSANLDLRACWTAFALLDGHVDRAGVRDVQDTRIAGFPYLRVNRLLQRLAVNPQDARTRAWIGELAALDERARKVELANLPAAAREELERSTRERSGGALTDLIASCRLRLVENDLADPDRIPALRERAHVPRDYSSWKRILGLYPLTALAFSAGIGRLEARLQATFDEPERAARGVRVRYGPRESKSLRPEQVREIVRRSTNALGLPVPAGDDRDTLLAAFAPRFVVDETGPHDRIGALAWTGPDALHLDADRPSIYGRIAHTLVGERILLQLVYTLWFSERPADGWLDLLAGRFDGLVWRVTLAPDGEPWLFDSIHPCGCYHQFFATARAQPRPAPNPLEEWAFVPQRLPRMRDAELIVVHVAARTHYIERIEVAAAAVTDRTYRLADENELRSLPVPGGGRRSAYGPDGIVAGSERAERFFFWPMGIANPGAMRQWGRHATAFVGERHFDDPDLLEKRFELLDATLQE